MTTSTYGSIRLEDESIFDSVQEHGRFQVLDISKASHGYTGTLNTLQARDGYEKPSWIKEFSFYARGVKYEDLLAYAVHEFLNSEKPERF